jgi:hypothetical protein
VGGAPNKEAWCKLVGTKPNWMHKVVARHRGVLSTPTKTVKLDGANYVTLGGEKYEVSDIVTNHGTIYIDIKHVRSVKAQSVRPEKPAKQPHPAPPDAVAGAMEMLATFGKKKTTAKNKEADAPRTHKMQPDGKRTWCGKRPGTGNLGANTPMSDDPTCRQCQNGEWTAQQRKAAKPTVTVVVLSAKAEQAKDETLEAYGICPAEDEQVAGD